ncbi:MAG: hypothetical protein HY584_00575 [Candidatus Omnitrophica bacterium]|nr:hypothetical protein [Candidatus Omnitrophota bacterium]
MKQSQRLHRALLREYFSGRTGSSSPKVLRRTDRTPYQPYGTATPGARPAL